jgi:putative nucleotidyltransferase with HDIG domain
LDGDAMNSPSLPQTDKAGVPKGKSSFLYLYLLHSSKKSLWKLFIITTLITFVINIFHPEPTLLVLYAIPVILATLIFMNLWIVMVINLILTITCVLLAPGPPVWSATIIPFFGYLFISYIVKELFLVSKRNIEQRKEFEQLFDDTIHAITQSLDARDAYTAYHSRNVAKYAREIAEVMQLPAVDIEKIYIAGILHDTGKIGTPEAILTKKGRLTDDEFEIMKEHARHGYNILKNINYLTKLGITKMLLHHHEKIDGSGYPDGLKGDEIPLGARILAVSDAFDAMTTDRSYRNKLSLDEAIEQLEKNKGTQFDPVVVDSLLKLVKTNHKLRKEVAHEAV